MALFLESIRQVREILDEASRKLRTAQREINPLKAKGKNPIKKVVSSFVRAKSTRSDRDIAATKAAHRVGVMYADQHGLPRLAKQIIKHSSKIPKPKKPVVKKAKKSQTRPATRPAGRKSTP